MSEKIKIGFVGVGGMGQCAHLKNYVTVADCQVVALAELRPKLREAVARKYGIARTYASGQEMLAKEKLDGLVASQMFDLHGSILPPLYAAGLPLFTEKPLAASVAVGEKLLKTLKKSSSWHMVGYHKRSDPATMYAKAEIERLQKTGELGKLKYVRVTMPAGEWTQGGFNDLVQTDEKIPPTAKDVQETWGAPYFNFVNYYIHQVNLLAHLLGERYKVTFADRAGVLLVAETPSGVTGIIEMSPYLTSTDWQEGAFVCFEKGWIKIELPAPLASNRAGQVTVFLDPGLNGATPKMITPVLPAVHAMRQQAMNFIRAIKGEIKPLCDAAEALEDLKVAQDYIKLWKG